MIIAAHQPNFLPNLGFFYKMIQAELFVVVTNLQFEKHEAWQQRHKIKGPNNDIWLTIPALGSQNQNIKDVVIDNKINWRKKHKRTLETVYSKTQEKEILKQITEVYDKEWERLVDINYAFITLLKDILGIKTSVVLDEEVVGQKENLLISICKKYNGHTYLSGLGAKAYMNPERHQKIKQNNITYKFVEENLTEQYPYSTIHYLLTQGTKKVLEILKNA